MNKKFIGGLAVMRLASGQTKPDREPLRVDDDVDFGREPASAATEAMIWTPFMDGPPLTGLELIAFQSSM